MEAITRDMKNLCLVTPWSIGWLDFVSLYDFVVSSEGRSPQWHGGILILSRSRPIFSQYVHPCLVQRTFTTKAQRRDY